MIMLSSKGGNDESFGGDVQEDAPAGFAPAKSKKSAPKPEEEISIEDIPF